MKVTKVLMVVVVVCAVNAGAIAGISWTYDVKIGSPADHAPGYTAQAKLNVVAPGQVDIAWYKNGAAYSYWDASIAGNPGSELVRSTSKCDIGGIGRDSSGNILIGYTDSVWKLNESKKSGSTWAWELAGNYQSFYRYGENSYSVNPVTGKGEFVAQDYTVNQLRHIYRDGGGNWTYSTVLSGNYKDTFPNITHASNGTAYFVGDTGYGTSSYTGGLSGSMTALTTTQGSVYRHAAIEEQNGTLYAFAPGNYWYHLYTSTNGGTTWTEDVKIPMVTAVTPSYTVSYEFSSEIAVGPNGEIAALFYDKAGTDYYNLYLAYRDNLADTSWDITKLSNSTTMNAQQFPDVAFDSNASLYVAYYDPAVDEMHLLSTVPEPTTIVLLLGGCLVMCRKRFPK